MATAKVDAGARILGLRNVDPVSELGPSCFGEPTRRIRARVGGTTVGHVSWALTRLKCFTASSFNSSHRRAFHLKSVWLARAFTRPSLFP